MVLQRKLRPSIAHVNVQLDPRYAASKHTTAPINRTRPSPRKHSPDVATRARKQTSDCSLLLIYRPRKDERLSRPAWLVTYQNKVPSPGVEPGHVTHPSTNRARRRVTSLIRPTPLPLRHAATTTINLQHFHILCLQEEHTECGFHRATRPLNRDLFSTSQRLQTLMAW